MKKLYLILAVAMMALVTGCSSGGNSSNGSTGEVSKKDKVKIEIMSYKPELLEALDSAADRYVEENPNVTINIQASSTTQDIVARMQSDNPPTIFNVGGIGEFDKWSEKLEDLSDQPWVEHAAAGVLDQMTRDGKVYGLPYTIEGYGYIYNKEIFDVAGIDIEDVKTFVDLEKAVKELDRQIKAGELKDEFPYLEAVFEVPAKETWVLGQHTIDVLLAQEFSGPIGAFEAKEVEFKYKDDLKKLIDFQTDYTTNAENKGNLNSVDYTMVIENGLAIERVAMVQQGNWIYPAINSIDPEVAKNLRMIPITIDGVVENKLPIGVPMYWAVNKEGGEAEKAAAKDFLNWLYQSEEGKKIIVDEFFFIPPFTNYGDLTAKDPLSLAVQKASEEGNTYVWSISGYPSGWAMEVVGAEIQKYLSGVATFDEAIQNSKDAFKKARG